MKRNCCILSSSNTINVIYTNRFNRQLDWKVNVFLDCRVFVDRMIFIMIVAAVKTHHKPSTTIASKNRMAVQLKAIKQPHLELNYGQKQAVDRLHLDGLINTALHKQLMGKGYKPNDALFKLMNENMRNHQLREHTTRETNLRDMVPDSTHSTHSSISADRKSSQAERLLEWGVKKARTPRNKQIVRSIPFKRKQRFKPKPTRAIE